MVAGLSGATPEDIIKISPDFIASLGFQQALTPSRNNGFLNMFKLMQQKALQMVVASVGAKQEDGAARFGQGAGERGRADQSAPSAQQGAAAASSEAGPITRAIQSKLSAGLQPST